MAGVNFERSTYNLYYYKQTPGDGPHSPESPTSDALTPQAARGITAAQGVALAAGAMVAQRVVGVLRTEIGATTGNEVLQTDFNNMMTGVGIGGAVLAGGWAAAGAIAIGATVGEIVRQRSVMRDNRATEYNNRLRGQRVAYGQGGVY